MRLPNSAGCSNGELRRTPGQIHLRNSPFRGPVA
jgi:hypothetical protein